MSNAKQFICEKCHELANVRAYEEMLDGSVYCRCEHCGAKNQVVRIDLSASQPGLLPVTKLLQ